MAGSLKVVLFDFDGTLSDSLLPIHGIINAMRAERGAPARAAADMRSAMSLVGDELVRGSLAEAARDPAEDLAEFRRLYAKVQPDPTHLYPGTVEMLQQLKAMGLRCAICSNKPQDLLMRFVEGSGLSPYFDVVVGADSQRKGKPDPAMLHHTLEQLGARVEDAVLVGDSEADAQAAHAAGMPFVLVSFGYAAGALEDIPHRHRIDALSALPALLKDGPDRPEPSSLHQRLHKWMHLIRFLAVGGLNTLFGYCLFAVQVWLGVRPEIAILVGNIVGPLFNYVTYGKLAFSQKLGRKNLPRYIANYVAFYLINIALLRLCLDGLHLSVYVAQMLLTPFLALGQYFSLRYFVFR